MNRAFVKCPRSRRFEPWIALQSSLAYFREADAAFEWLEKAYERRSGRLGWIRASPRSDPLRSDPRFDDLLRRIGFPES